MKKRTTTLQIHNSHIINFQIAINKEKITVHNNAILLFPEVNWQIDVHLLNEMKYLVYPGPSLGGRVLIAKRSRTKTHQCLSQLCKKHCTNM